MVSASIVDVIWYDYYSIHLFLGAATPRNGTISAWLNSISVQSLFNPEILSIYKYRYDFLYLKN